MYKKLFEGLFLLSLTGIIFSCGSSDLICNESQCSKECFIVLGFQYDIDRQCTSSGGAICAEPGLLLVSDGGKYLCVTKINEDTSYIIFASDYFLLGREWKRCILDDMTKIPSSCPEESIRLNPKRKR